jgi:hypothetical protein
LFENQPANEKRKLLDFVLSNSVWKNGKLLAEYRQPFDLLAVAIASDEQLRSLESARAAENENWLPKNAVLQIILSTFLNVSGVPRWIRTRCQLRPLGFGETAKSSSRGGLEWLKASHVLARHVLVSGSHA